MDANGNELAGTQTSPQFYNESLSPCSTPSPTCPIQAWASFTPNCGTIPWTPPVTVGPAPLCAMAQSVGVSLTVQQVPGVTPASGLAYKSRTISNAISVPLTVTKLGTPYTLPIWQNGGNLGTASSPRTQRPRTCWASR